MRRKKDTKSGIFIVRSFATFVVCCLVSACLTSCSHSKIFNQRIDEAELARILVDSMQDLNSTEDLYEIIPDEQKDGLTYSEFYEYVTVLQKLLPHGSRATSFSIVEGEEKEKLISQMMDNSSEEYETLIRGCVPIRIETTGERKSDYPIYIYLQTQPDGTIYINRRWAQNCMDLFAFSNHYFEAYENSNLEDVKRLLSSMETQEPIPNEPSILEAKANEMIRFYSVNVQSPMNEYEMVAIDASNLVFLQPEVLDSTLHASSREVIFRSDADDQISVADPIKSDLKTVDLYLYYKGHRTLRVGEHASAASVRSLLGEPISVTCGPILDGGDVKKNRSDGLRRILVRYPGFVLTIYGHYTSETEWDGTCIRFRIWDSANVSIGERITITETSWEVLKRYPYADEGNYQMDVIVDDELYELIVEIDKAHTNGNGSYPISSLRLSKIS